MDGELMLTAERLREILDYDSETGIFTWRETRGCVKAGSLAGYVRHDGYLTIRVDRVLYLGHRLAWLYVHGTWPDENIDHGNRDTGDNSFVNLRECDQRLNNGNRKLDKSNTSGFKGVSWSKSRTQWRAYICDRGHQRHLGYFCSREAAAAAYANAAIAVFGEFARPIP